jgi:hypothetical protein
MQLRAVIAGLILVTLGCGMAEAQSLSPMRKQGMTPSDTKGFKLIVGNPYKRAMTFEIIPMDTRFEIVADRAVVRPSEVRLGAGMQRTVTLAFKIPAGQKERTIGVCVQPKDLKGSILPRVCGTYTGVVLTAGGKGG